MLTQLLLQSDEEKELLAKRRKIDDVVDASSDTLPTLSDNKSQTGESKICEQQSAEGKTADAVVVRSDGNSQNEVLPNSFDGLEESLICAICQDILYNCIRYNLNSVVRMCDTFEIIGVAKS